VSWLNVQGRSGTAKCRGSLRPLQALPPARGCHASPGPALPGRQRYYEPMRQSPSLTTALVGKPWTAGLCRLLSAPAGMSTFPTLSPPSVWRRLDPYPAVFLRCVPVSSRRTAASPWGRAAWHNLCKATSTEKQFRGCSHLLMFRLHHLLGPQVAPTARPLSVLGGRAIYTRLSLESLPAPSTGIATCLNRATGTAGLAPAGFRPCRLLPTPQFRKGIP